MRRYRIGRADTNDIVLADTTVSREHAELVEIGDGRFEIKDLGSTFGTSVREGQDWAKVTVRELGHDAQIRIGEYETTIAELVRDTDKTVVRGRTVEPAASPPPRPPDRTTPPPPFEPNAPVLREATEPPRREPPAPREATAMPAPADSEKTEPPAQPPPPAAPAPPKPAAASPAAPSPASPRPAPPRPAPPRPASPRPAPPRPAPPGPASEEGTAAPSSAPSRPAAAPAFQFLRNMSPEQRTLLWIGLGFAGFLFVSLITLVLVLVL